MSFFIWLFESIIGGMSDAYSTIRDINAVIGSFLAAMVLYRGVYTVIGLFWTRKFTPAKDKHKYAIVIAARNEKNVIGNLIDSINKQDYPRELLTIFIVADNCDDETAEIARSKGAICYERFDSERKTKGFALQYLFEKIEEDYGRMSFDGYFVFDADNLLKKDYISRMNDAFDSGEKIITSYRHSKNFDENWIASTYAIHWLRSVRTGHRARSILRLATNIQGTGFLFASEIVRDGWKYTSLTEDRALTADAVAQGYRISYNDEAIFYDEQPVDLKVALRQRLRWSRGHILAFLESGPKLFINIFFGKKFVKTNWSGKNNINAKPKNFKEFRLRLIESIRHRFASYDMFWLVTPIVIFNIFRWLLVVVILYACYSYEAGIINVNIFGGSTYFAQLLRNFVSLRVNIAPGINAFFSALGIAIWARIFYQIGTYLENMWVAIYIFVIERKRIKKIPLHKKILYCFTWPIFDIIGRWTMYIALFKKVEWKPIPHESKITIDDIEKQSAA